jgi:hypothetical protein
MESLKHTMVVVMRVWVIWRANVMHLVRRAAFHAAGNGFLTCELDLVSLDCIVRLDVVVTHSYPNHIVGVDGESGAAAVLLIAGGVDHNGVLERACSSISRRATFIPNALSTQCPNCSRIVVTYRDGWHPEASCRRYQCPASFLEFRDAPNR